MRRLVGEVRPVHFCILKAKTARRKEGLPEHWARCLLSVEEVFALISLGDYLVPSLRCTLEVSLNSHNPDHLSVAASESWG